MAWFFYVSFFIFGLAVGSFLNCVIYRLKSKESFLFGHSHCPFCQKQLLWYDLLPVVSFFILKGKCRWCQKKISWQYPLVEIVGGILSLFVSYYCFHLGGCPYYNALLFIFYFIVSCFFVVIFVYDLKYYLIPDSVIFPAIFFVASWQFAKISDYHLSLAHYRVFLNPFLSGLIVGAIFFLLVFFSKEKWMGWGDVGLGFLIGLLLGFPNIFLSLFLTFTFGALVGLALMILRKKTLKSEVPFGPFLVLGAFIALFWGTQIINWYLNWSSSLLGGVL